MTVLDMVLTSGGVTPFASPNNSVLYRAFEGEVVLGVPHDIVYPAIPRVLQQFNAAYPRFKGQLLTLNTSVLKQKFARGECDMILTTEAEPGEGGEGLLEANGCRGSHDPCQDPSKSST